MLHYGQAQVVAQQRQQVLQAAYPTHPERFVKRLPLPPAVPTQAWIIRHPQLMRPSSRSNTNFSLYSVSFLLTYSVDLEMPNHRMNWVGERFGLSFL